MDPNLNTENDMQTKAFLMAVVALCSWHNLCRQILIFFNYVCWIKIFYPVARVKILKIQWNKSCQLDKTSDTLYFTSHRPKTRIIQATRCKLGSIA